MQIVSHRNEMQIVSRRNEMQIVSHRNEMQGILVLSELYYSDGVLLLCS